MSKKSENYYFENFIACAQIACEAAQLLQQILTDYAVDQLDENLQKMHAIEHKADQKKHEMLEKLVKEFITPIERDDIVELSQRIDDVTDFIEDVMIHLDIGQMQTMREDCLPFAQLILKCCNGMTDMLTEFQTFRKSKRLRQTVIELNHLEEEGDAMYIRAMKDLHQSTESPIDAIAWREVYKSFERVCDACEDVANIVESILIENL